MIAGAVAETAAILRERILADRRAQARGGARRHRTGEQSSERARHPDVGLSLAEIAPIAYFESHDAAARHRRRARGERPVPRRRHTTIWANATHVCTCEVDIETGVRHAVALHRERGLRPDDQPQRRRGTDRRRHRAGHRRRALRAPRVRRRRQPGRHHVPRLPPADIAEVPVDRARPHRDARSRARWLQGRGRGRRHRRAARGGERRGRRARAVRRHHHPTAGQRRPRSSRCSKTSRRRGAKPQDEAGTVRVPRARSTSPTRSRCSPSSATRQRSSPAGRAWCRCWRCVSPVFEHLVDLRRVDELRGIERQNGALRIGAGTTQAAIEHRARSPARCPLLARATPLIGHFQIRNRGTIGGSIAHADPAAEYPGGGACARRRARSRSVRGRRDDPGGRLLHRHVDDRARRRRDARPRVDVPGVVGRCGFAVEELARRHGDFAIAGAAVAVELDGDDVSRRCAIGLFGMGSAPRTGRRSRSGGRSAPRRRRRRGGGRRRRRWRPRLACRPTSTGRPTYRTTRRRGDGGPRVADGRRGGAA